MKPIRIDFYHDVICSFCFPMSYTMRRIQEKYPNAVIVHHGFALAFTSKHMNAMFQTHTQAKQEILTHWEKANTLDVLHRFNIEGMRQEQFLFPTSKLPLYVCEAARQCFGEEAYWTVFDTLQEALFVRHQDISNEMVVKDILQLTKLDVQSIEKWIHSDVVAKAVEEDIKKAAQLNIHSVPTLIINDTHKVSGYRDVDTIVSILQSLDSTI